MISSPLSTPPAIGYRSRLRAATDLGGSSVPFTVTGTVASPTVDVAIENNFFTPSDITISAGTQVRWTMGATGTVSHAIESLGSPNITSSCILPGPGTVYTFTFTTPGVYSYDCAIYGAR